MTCIRNLTAFDRFLMGTRDREEAERRAREPVCRLLVARLKWASAFALVIAVVGVGTMLWLASRQNAQARQHLAEVVANDCVDRPGDVAFRNVLVELVAINEGRKPSNPRIARLPRSQQTAAILRQGLEQAGDVPTCILRARNGP